MSAPEMVICCRVDDPDPACVVSPGYVLGACTRCRAEIRIGASSVKAMIEHGVQPWCVQCFAAEHEPKGWTVITPGDGP